MTGISHDALWLSGQDSLRGESSSDRHRRHWGGASVRCRLPRGRPIPPSPDAHHGSPDLGVALRRFRRAEHGSSALEAVLGISILLVVVFAPLTALLVGTTVAGDSAAHAANAAARAIALLPAAPASDTEAGNVACAAIQDELGDDTLDCAARFTITIAAYETPTALAAGTARWKMSTDPAVPGSGAPPGGEDGDMVVVQLEDQSAKTFTIGVARNERAG